MKHLSLFLIISLGAFLRLYQLGSIPNSYTPDELAQAYSAYSILQTGHDEWGSGNLLKLRSFGDYKPSLQAILMIPSVHIFGLTPIAARLPNALLSIFIIPLTYLLSKKLFSHQHISLLSSFLVSVSPMAFPLSRVALEANIVILFSLLAIVLYLHHHYQFSVIVFGLSLLTYHSAKLFAPMSIIFLNIFFKKSIKSSILFTVIYLSVNLLTSNHRSSDIAIFNPTDSWASVSLDRYQITQSGMPDFITRIFNNKLSYTVKIFFHNYLSYLSPQFLATDGAGETTYGMLPGNGAVGLVPFIGFITALYYLIRHRNQQVVFLFFMVLTAILAGAIAKGSYSANRVSLIIPYINILVAYGFFKIAKTRITNLFIVLLISFESLFFLQKYFFQANQILAHGMLYGHKEALEYLKDYPDWQVIYSRKLSEPQAYVMFFHQIDPLIVQRTSPDWLRYQDHHSFLDQLPEYRLQNFFFKEINFPSDSLESHTILVGRPEEFPAHITPNRIIYYPNHNQLDPAIYIYHNL